MSDSPIYIYCVVSFCISIFIYTFGLHLFGIKLSSADKLSKLHYMSITYWFISFPQNVHDAFSICTGYIMLEHFPAGVNVHLYASQALHIAVCYSD